MIENLSNANIALQNLIGKMNALWSGKATSADRLSLKEIMEICRYIADEYEKYLGENEI